MTFTKWIYSKKFGVDLYLSIFPYNNFKIPRLTTFIENLNFQFKITPNKQFQATIERNFSAVRQTIRILKRTHRHIETSKPYGTSSRGSNVTNERTQHFWILWVNNYYSDSSKNHCQI